ncbi:hypothetical protein [Aquabacterium humicola]|uniref:hypothetical protein n=1 Tax=Aquabacterium humicola TaxID=3237377 RepID=UPI002543E29D|nr:hypothetical protein [Rubrivivax pictus]
MVWNADNLSFIGGPNYSAYSSPNYTAYAGPNYAAYGAPNYAAYGGPNYAAYSAPNYAATSAPNYAAYAAPNYAAQGSPNYAAMPGGGAVAPMAPGVVLAGNGTGAGGASGTGFLGGYGPVARFEYATPAALGPLPWILDFAHGDGWPPFPTELRLRQQDLATRLEWQPGDWDPGLRFWALPFDPRLTEWLQDLNLAAPAVMAAREFAAQHPQWLAPRPDLGLAGGSPLHARFAGQPHLLDWTNDPGVVATELNELVDLMCDDRARYLEEARVQSGQATPYFVHLMGFDPAARPWTMELMNCASAIGNLVKMQYKASYRRVRPSFLCPGLLPPWGPPQHPAFPSGHSTVMHLTTLFLLSVDGIADRFGIFEPDAGKGRRPCLGDFLDSAPRHAGAKAGATPAAKGYGDDQRSPLLWLAWRIARGRERLGLHYRSDSAAGRVLAALVWDACINDDSANPIVLPSLRKVLHHARAEWPVFEGAPTTAVNAPVAPLAAGGVPRNGAARKAPAKA